MPRTYLKVPFQQKDAAKALGAKWDASLSSWYVPEGSDVSAFATWLTGPRSASVPVVSATWRSLTTFEAGRALDVGRSAVPLSQLLAGVAGAVAAAYRAGVWTTVEVTEVRARGGHVYLELSERDRSGVLIAKTTGTIWADAANRLLPEFERATGATLAPGIKLLVRARPVYKPQYGLSVDIDAIDPAFTLGELEARKREIRSRLQAEGVFDAQRRLPAPWDFNSVLVVAPDSAAGLGDFRTEAERLVRFGLCRFAYASSRFQGEGAANEIIGALQEGLRQWACDQASVPDAVVIIRGGGAVNDLAWLNDYALARFVCDLDVPVFTGIGHERDSTVLDEVAQSAFDTPSKVIAAIEQLIARRAQEASDAYLAVVRATELATQRAQASVARLDAVIRAGAVRQLEHARRASVQQFANVKEVSTATVHQARGLTRNALDSVRQDARATIVAARSGTRGGVDFVLERAGSHAVRAREALLSSLTSLEQGARRSIVDARAGSEALLREIAGQGPEKTVARGFAVVREAGGKTVTRAAALVSGQGVTVQFLDGSVTARIEKDKP